MRTARRVLDNRDLDRAFFAFSAPQLKHNLGQTEAAKVVARGHPSERQ
jgi:hypothetical protein